MNKMHPEIKRQWCEALRSGEYEQARGQLCGHAGKMCCLGVAYDAVLGDAWEWDEHRWEWRPVNQTEYTILLSSWRALLGISIFEHDALVAMNDDGRTFAEIADYIEENL